MAKNKKKDKKKRPLISKLLFVVLALAMLYLYARYVGTTGIYVREYNVVDEKIPESFDGFSIVQVSDLELGSTFNLSDMPTLIKTINDLKPMAVVFTGDIVSDGYNLSSDEEEKLIEYFNLIDALIGKYAVKGDDDTTGLFDKIIENTEFIDLNNKNELIYYKGLTPIILIGLNSLNNDLQDFDEAFSMEENFDTFRILLAHEPDTVELIGDYKIDMMLSGHSHNNEINIPYITSLYNIKGAKKYSDEKYTVGDTKLFISSGLGTTKLKMRLFARPSISIFRLYNN